VDHHSETVRLLGLDFYQGKSTGDARLLSPEHQEVDARVGPYSDVYMLANNFIANMPFPEHCQTEPLVLECSNKIESRPTILDVAQGLGLETVADQSILRIPKMRLFMRFSAVAALVLISIVGITVSRLDPFMEQKTLFINSIETNPDGALAGLVEMRASYLDKSDVLAEAIAMAKKSENQLSGQDHDSRGTDPTGCRICFSAQAHGLFVGPSSGNWRLVAP
jgi:hypothetical protein